MSLNINHLKELEAESIYVLREVAAQFDNPVILFSGGKDSILMTYLAVKAFHPAKIPFPLLHIDTGHNFEETIRFRDEWLGSLGANLKVALVEEAIQSGLVREEKGFNASTNVYAENGKTFLLEIDSSLLFNSASKITLNKQDRGGLLKWSLPDQIQTDRVYYWRTAIEDADEENVWKQSSFIIETASSEGWNQSHHDQYQQDTFINLRIDENENRIEFNPNPIDFSIKNIVRGSGDSRPRVISDNGTYFSHSTTSSFNGVCMVVVEPENLNCVDDLQSNGQEIIYAYTWGIGEGHMFKVDNQNERQEVMNFISDIIPDGSYVFFLTIQSGFNDFGYVPDQWAADSLNTGDPNLFNVLESYGAQQIRQLETQGSKPYGLIFQKGNPDFNVEEGINTISNDFGNVSTSLTSNFDTGFMRSTFIGPSTQWNTLKYSISDIENHDSIRVDLYGVKTDGNRDLLSSFTDPVLEQDLSDLIPASVYPQLFLEYFVEDKILKTVPSLDYWKVQFEPYPELAVAPNNLLVLDDTLTQGEIMDFRLSSQNIGTVDMDSVLVRISLQNESGYNNVSYKKYAPLEKGASFTISESFNTDELQGIYSLTAFVNPDNDQNEQFLFNNVFSEDILVIADNINPLLSVKFDGQRILDGDIVAPASNISISVKDENPYLILNDTSLFEIRIKYPDNSIKNIYFDNPSLIFTPANSEENTALIEFENNFEQTGIHTLYIEARDVAGNAISNLSESPDGLAEGLNYKIDFEVIHKSSISNFYNYPNPFSNSTRFVYTLTGDRVPAFFKIQIMTSSGKVIKEISQSEIGPLRIGTHQTEYAWDGRDQFGDKLANGVYLYKVIAKDENGDNFEKYDLNDNEAVHFLNGFGKMVIIN